MLSKEFLAFAPPPSTHTHVALGKWVFISVLSLLRTSGLCTGILNKASAMFDTINNANASNRGNLR